MNHPEAKLRVDAAIITIREDEFRAVLETLPDVLDRVHGRRIYEIRWLERIDGRRYIVAVVRASEQGNTAAQAVANDLIEDLAPRWVLVVGIAGGRPSDEFSLGDVIVSTRIVDHTVGAALPDGASEFAHGGGPLLPAAERIVANLPARDRDLGAWGSTIRYQRPGGDTRCPRYVTGAITSSDLLMRDPERLRTWLSSARQVLACEMESAGVYRATHARCVPFIAIRGISDVIGIPRDSEWTAYAAASAAAFTHAFLRTGPIPMDEQQNAANSSEIGGIAAPPNQSTAERIIGGEPLTAPINRGINPFEYGTPVPPDRFAGRHAQRSDVRARIGGVSAQSVSIVGMHRSGKSSLLKLINEQIREFCSEAQNPLVVSLDLQFQKFHTPEGIVEGIRRGVERTTGRAPWSAAENCDDYAIEDGFVALRDKGYRLLVLIDELERIGTRLDQFQTWGEDMRAKAGAGYLSLVISTRRSLAEVYSHCGLTSPFGNIFSTVTLGAMPRSEWEALVHNGFSTNGKPPSARDMSLIAELGGGLPFYVQMAASLLWQHGDHDATRQAFRFQSVDRFRELWAALSSSEQSALRFASGMRGIATPSSNLVETLERFGLLRAKGETFSSAFTTFVREQP